MKNLKLLLVAGLSLLTSAYAFAENKPPLMVSVSGGEFTMGEPGGKNNPAHKVRVSSFQMATYPVSAAEWREFTKEEKISFLWKRDYVAEDSTHPFPWQDNDPIAFIFWDEAVQYCNWLSRKHGLQEAYRIVQPSGYRSVNGQQSFQMAKVTWDRAANGFRLPTEAEWEFAARGGVKSKGYPYPGSRNVDDVAWYAKNVKTKDWMMPIGQKAPNELGLYDMSGNVGQWCWDFFDGNYYRQSPVDNPAGPTVGNAREYLDTREESEHAHSTRGGDILSSAEFCTVTKRTLSPEWNRSWIGFRVVRNAK